MFFTKRLQRADSESVLRQAGSSSLLEDRKRTFKLSLTCTIWNQWFLKGNHVASRWFIISLNAKLWFWWLKMTPGFC